MTAHRAAALALAAGLLVAGCTRERGTEEASATTRAPGSAARIAVSTSSSRRRRTAAVREGLAAAILIDVSGSMKGAVAGDEGRHEPKIDIARRAARDLVDQFARYADEHRDEPVLLGLYEFSQRNGVPDCRPIMPMGPPDRASAEAALDAVRPDGGTPIGNAMIAAKRELDAHRPHAPPPAGRHRRREHGRASRPSASRPRSAAGRRRSGRRSTSSRSTSTQDRFAKVRDAGGLVLAAANARELNDTLDSLLRGKILIEK